MEYIRTMLKRKAGMPDLDCHALQQPGRSSRPTEQSSRRVSENLGGG